MQGQLQEIGFLHELGSTFKSTQDDIRNNYLNVVDKMIMQSYEQQ